MKCTCVLPGILLILVFVFGAVFMACDDNNDSGSSPKVYTIAFMSGRDGNDEIYIMDADGSNEIQLTDNGESDYTPRFSPDGGKIFFTSSRYGNYEIYMMNPDRSGQKNIT